ncbi:MAG: hypothetical protein LUQ47_05155, partial [Methanotrichaceae archaeon]|nr:hypothetical protein [Methanotrichaceae archaeon]
DPIRNLTYLCEYKKLKENKQLCPKVQSPDKFRAYRSNSIPVSRKSTMCCRIRSSTSEIWMS